MTREEWRDRAVEHGVEIVKLKKQLAIAVEALKTYAQDKDCWEDVREECKLVLKQIKELEKCLI